MRHRIYFADTKVYVTQKNRISVRPHWPSYDPHRYRHLNVFFLRPTLFI